jgi:hypothetical protein
MNVGPELPGEFVSDELRNDCARFLDELRRLVERRKVGELEDAVGHAPDHCEVTHRDRPGQVADGR